MRVVQRLLIAVVAMAGIALPGAALAGTGSHAAVQSAGYTVVQVNPTTFTNVLSKKVPAIPLRAGAWLIRTRSCTSTCYEVTAKGSGNPMEIEATGFSTFNRSHPAGALGDIYTTPNGLCVHAQQNVNAIEGVSGSCGAGNTGSQWFDDGTGRLENSAYQKFMGVDNLGNNQILIDEFGTGAYYMTPQNVG